MSRAGALRAWRRVGDRGDPDDLAAVVDVKRRGDGGARPVDSGDAPPGIPQEPGAGRGGHNADAHDLAAVVDAEGEGALGAGDLEGGDPTPLQQEPVRRHGGLTAHADDLDAVVDPGGGPRLDAPEAPPLPRIAVEGAGGVPVLAHDLAVVVDVKRLAGERSGEVEPDIPAAVQQEAAAVLDVVGADVAAGVAVDADDLAAVVDPLGLGPLGAGHVDVGEPAPVQPQAVRRPAGIGEGPHDLAAVV